MGRVLTNETAWSYSIESALGVAGTTWFQLEPNDIPQFGASYSKVARAPVSADRQRRKSIVSDLDSAAEFPLDVIMSHVDNLAERLMFATAVNSDLLFRGADATSSGYTIPSATAAQAAKLQFGATGPKSLLYARGYAVAGNNGLKPLTVDVAATNLVMEVAGAATETAPANAEVEVAGIRANIADLDITVAGTTATITSGNGGGTAIDFTTLGLTRGQRIHVGGLTSSEQFSAGAGYGRISTIAAGTLVLDRIDASLVTDDGVGETIDLLYGRYIRNVSTTSSEYLESSVHIEGLFPTLGAGDTARYQYGKGNFLSQMAWNLPLTDKATMDLSFIGTDTDAPSSSRLTGADAPIVPIKTAAFGTTIDLARLVLQDTDDTGLLTDFKNLTVTVNNGITPEKVMGTLGGKYINIGNFEVDISGVAIFTEEPVIARIESNATIGLFFGLKNDDGAIFVDIPSMTLGDGSYDFPVNESVLINLTGEAHKDALLGTSKSISLFAVVPA